MQSNIDDRGQTAIDFVAGAGMFVLAVVFMLAFVPSMFAPFFGLGIGDALIADRTAAYLVEDKLVDDPTLPGALNDSKVDALLDTSSCEDGGGAELASNLSSPTENINVSIGSTSEPYRWSCGDAPSDSETISRRIVIVNDAQYTLRVVVW